MMEKKNIKFKDLPVFVRVLLIYTAINLIGDFIVGLAVLVVMFLG